MIKLFAKRPSSAEIERLHAEIKAIRAARPSDVYTDGAGELCTRTGSRPAYAFDSFGAITGRADIGPAHGLTLTDADRASVAALIELCNADAARVADAA